MADGIPREALDGATHMIRELRQRAEQAEALNAELAAALRAVLEVESLCGDVGCAQDGVSHFADCPIIVARAALSRLDAAGGDDAKG